MSSWNRGISLRERVAPRFRAPSAFVQDALATFAFLTLAGCQVMSSPQEIGMEAVSKGNKVQIATHAFGAHCFGGFGCQVRYDDKFIRDRPQSAANPEISEDGYEGRLIAPYVGIQSFPSPAQVTWRSVDGSSLSAEIDIGQIMSEWMTRSEGGYTLQAGTGLSVELEVLLVVVDRTVNVFIHNPSDQSSSVGRGPRSKKLIQVFSKTY